MAPSEQPEDSVFLASEQLLEDTPTNVFRNIVDDDYKKLHDSAVDVGKFELMAERALILDLYYIQGWYKAIDDWRDDPGMRLTIAMGTSAFNTLMLMRHSIKLGYWAETGSLERVAHEYTTRCLLLPLDPELVELISSGKTVQQSEIDRRLDRLTPEHSGKALRTYRKNYRRASVYSHPNLFPISMRNPHVKGDGFSDDQIDQLVEVVGLDTAIGGITVGTSLLRGFAALAWRAHSLATALMHEFADYDGYGKEHFEVVGRHVDAALEVFKSKD